MKRKECCQQRNLPTFNTHISQRRRKLPKTNKNKLPVANVFQINYRMHVHERICVP